ncbi:MAG: transglutaminase, partial [Thermodesulfovibrionales bacterium]
MKKIIFVISFLMFFASQVVAKERIAEVTIKFDLSAPEDARNVKLWIPYPVSDKNQDILDVNLSGNFSSSGIYREGEYGNAILYAEWNSEMKNRLLTFKFKVKRKEVITKNFPEKELPFAEEEFSMYLKSSKSLPLTEKVKDYATKITKGKKTIYDKAKSIYDWIVENMHRDPNVKGCGFGEVERLL